MDSSLKRAMAPPLSLMTLAASTPPGHDIVIEDENVARLRTDDRPGLVGITVTSDTSPRAYEIAAGYRARGVPVVLGGIHASAVPDEALSRADAVCIGEGEEPWPRIVADAESGKLRGRYGPAPPTDPAAIPFPRRDLVRPSRYLYSNVVSAGRGCPHGCEFCYNSAAYAARGRRARPAASIIEEIRRAGMRQVMFIDDNIAGDPRRAEELARALAPLGLTWHAAASADVVNRPGLLDAMRESGCRSLFIGFESINQRSVGDVRKSQNVVDRYDRLVAMCHEREIMVNASMVFGLEHDTPRVFADTLDWLVSRSIETMTAHILTPYPGTALYARLDRQARITDRDPRHYNTSRAVFEPAGMSARELEEGYRWIYREFYSMGNILKRMPRSGRMVAPYLMFNLGYRKFGRLTALAGRLGLMSAIGRAGARISYGV